MHRIIIGLSLSISTILALDIPIAEVEKRVFSKTIRVNSKVVQLSSAKENIMARMGGKITKYFVKQGQNVKRGQAIATINSLELSSLSTELKSLKKQLFIVNKNYNMVKKLYNTGVESRQNLNKQEEERSLLLSQIEGVKNKLSIMGSTGSNYTVYAGGAGKVSKILVPSNSVVDANTALLSIVKGGESLLLKSYIPLKYVADVKVGQKGEMSYGGKSYKMHISQVLPELDEQTQQLVVLSSLDESVSSLFVNAYVDSKLSIGEEKSYLSVKKTALNFFNNEWVVFVPKHRRSRAMSLPDAHDDEKHKEEVHDEHEGHDHAKHEAEEEEHNEHDEHEGHDEHEEEEVPYGIKIVKILKQNKKYVAIEGLEEHEDYVSDKAYHVKSLLLKSSLGGHGH